jgi:RNA polymerase sigma-70 factor, ECF subfamily
MEMAGSRRSFDGIAATESASRAFLVCERKRHGRTNTDASPEQRGAGSIFRAHYERIARVIGRSSMTRPARRELAVEVFLKWWRSPRAHGDQAEGWLYRTSVRKALDELRSQTRRNRFERLLGIARESPPTPEQLHAVNAEQVRVRTVPGALSRRHAELLLLRSQDLTYQEIAASLALNPNYVGSLVSRAQDAFRKEYLKRYGTK